MLAFYAVGCTEDLPVTEPLPDEESGSRTNEQTAADGGTGDGAGGGSSMTTGMGNASGGSSGDGGSGGAGGAPSENGGTAGSAGIGGAAPMSGAAGSRPAGAGGSAMPPVRVVAACMGRGGETVCDNTAMIKCGEAGNAEMMMTCDTVAQCRAGLAAGMCGSCDPGTIECVGAELRECSMTGEFTVKETCETEELCNEVGKMCDPPACEVDEHKCESGALQKCGEDRTEFEVVTSCPEELCDAGNKRCNECVPSSKECAGNVLKTCSVDGSGFTETPCAEPASMCVEDRCVQCTSNSECQGDNDCMQYACNTESGMCSTPAPKTVGTRCSTNGGKVCDLIGFCVECVTDRDCNPDERCSAILGCTPRTALQAGISILPGTISVTLNAGYSLHYRNPQNYSAGEITYTTGLLSVARNLPDSGSGQLLEGNPDTARSITFRGPGEDVCNPSLLASTDTEVTLSFSKTAGTCDVSVTIFAEED